MTKKLHIVPAFVRSFTVENIYTGESFEVECLEHALYYATVLMRTKKEKSPFGFWYTGQNVLYSHNLLGLFTESRRKNPHGWFESVERKVIWSKRVCHDLRLRFDARPIIVYDNLGTIVEVKELAKHKAVKPDFRYKSWEERTKQWYYHRELTDRNLCKRKGDGKKIKNEWTTVDYVDTYGEVSYHYNKGYHRYVRTKNEQTANDAHMDEYGQEMVRGKRRYLPTSWDDVSTSYWGCRRSWKHNSKRRKQWVPKD